MSDALQAEKTADSANVKGFDPEAFSTNLARAIESGGKALAAYLKPRDDAAIKDFTSLIDMNVDSPDAFTYRGQAYFRTGEYDRALADYDQAIRLRSNSPVKIGRAHV